MDSWKTLIVIFLSKPRKSKNALYYQKNLGFLCEIDQKVSIFVEKLKKMQPPKITFWSQIEPSIKSYECYVFAKIQMGKHPRLMDSWKTLIVFSFKNRERVKMDSIIKKNKLENCLVILKLGCFSGRFWIWPVLHGDFNLATKNSIFVQKSQKNKTSRNGPQKSNRSIGQEFRVFYV